MDRREFIRNSMLASGAFMVPSFLKPFEYLAKDAILDGYRSLVIIQLSGGNDGLNTIVPYRNDIYYNSRPKIALPQDKIIKVNDELGFNAALQPLKEIYDKGWMTIMNSVGYPNPDRSHFRAMDIWQTASSANQFLNTGWLGRYLDSDCPDCKNAYNIIEVDDTLSLAVKGEYRTGLAIKNPKQLYDATRDPFFKEMVSVYKNDHLNEDNLGYLSKTMIETYSSAEYVYETSKTYTNNVEYPDNPFAKNLKTIATFINSGLKTRVYYVSQTGFDTHVGQVNTQARLFKNYAESVSAFLKDLDKNNKLNDTLVLTFSEFGRRVAQNASNGTDHGTANNMFIYGGRLKKQGIYNAAPDLTDLDQGDLKYKLDFREVYATALHKWLGVKDSSILDPGFAGLDFIA